MCKQAWHVSCIGLNEITEGSLSKLKSWKCVLCLTLPDSVKTKLEEILKENILPLKEVMEKMEEKILLKFEEMKDSTAQRNEPTAYRDIAVKNLNKKVNETHRLVRNQFRQNNVTNEENDSCRRIVLKPKDIDVRNSCILSKKFNQYFPNVVLKHARISAGGSNVLEFEDEETATLVETDWKAENFGGNTGLVKPSSRNRTGIVKFVYDDIPEDEIENEIDTNYTNIEKYELFRRDEEFTGMIKVIFKTEDDFKQAIANKFTISRRKYIVEEFIQKPRVIKYNVCQRFGHVSRLCRSKNNPRCGKCSQEGHETKNCNTDPAEHKCFHCQQNDHVAGSYSCPIVQEKLQELRERQNYG